MMVNKINEVYDKYKIMPTLRLHMYRVAAVAQIIAADCSENLDKAELVSACLLHDMGNIIKFDLSIYPQFLEPEGLDYWESVKAEFINKYGKDEHNATHEIAKEVGVSERTQEILYKIGFSLTKERYLDSDFTSKIANYADKRVSPQGITSLEERERSGKARYAKNKGISRDNQKFEELLHYSKLLEKQIFESCNIKPDDITDTAVAQIISALKNDGIVV